MLMHAKIVLVTNSTESEELARGMAAAEFELVVTTAETPEYRAALAGAAYLVGFVAGSIDDALFRAAPELKLVQLLSARYDNADLEAARRAGVPVANNGGANSVAVSEHALLLMLAAYKGLVGQHANTVAGRWRGNAMPRQRELAGKTLGIIGLGNIGKKTARLAAAFGMAVQYYDIARLSEAAEDALGVRFRLLPEILRAADIISLHVPLNDTTKGMIGADQLALMQPSAILVNTSRGPVVDEAALLAALAEGRLAGAGLDVFAEEPPPADHPLFALDNVVLTPHVAGPTVESTTARLRNAFDNIQRVARGEPPLWVVPELAG